MIHEKMDIKVNDKKAALVTYVLDNFVEMDLNRKRPAVIICPGGGYSFTSNREGEPVAIAMNQKGFHAFILHYTTEHGNFPQALLELAKSMELIRENADKWHIDKEQLIVCGFSAGGHLAASLGVFWSKDILYNKLHCQKEKIRPNALLLAYPVISTVQNKHQVSFQNLLGEDKSNLLEMLSLEKQVSEDVPPTFIWHTYTDKTVSVQNSLLFAMELSKKKIPLELHIYGEGNHGLSLGTEEVSTEKFECRPEIQNWIDMFSVWVKKLKDIKTNS